MSTQAQVPPSEFTIFGAGRPYMAVAVLAHALIWAVAPALLIGNLHQDTLEAAYWGSDPALGYADHPPLLSWIIDPVIRFGHAPIFTLLLISQIGMVVAAVYVWRTVRLYASPGSAAIATTVALISPAATFYAVQVNHNSLLAPFWAVALFHGLAYLERGRWRDATLFAVATGLGLLTKYEMAFIVVCVLALALVVPRFRAAFRRPATYVAVLIAGAIFAPHVAWLAHHDWVSASYAAGARKMSDAGSLAFSVGNLLVGLLLLFLIPAAILLVANARFGADERPAWRSERGTIGAVLAFGPFLVMLIGIVATLQIAKPLWVTPMTWSSVVGLMLLFPVGRAGAPGERAVAKDLVALSAVMMAGFLAYLFIADAIGAAIGQPFTTYAADSRKLGAAVEDFWQAKASEPLACVVFGDDELAASAALWLRSRPYFVNVNRPFWSTPSRVERCRKSGAIVVLADPPVEQSIFSFFPAARDAPRRSVTVPAAFGFSHVTWPVELIFLAPNAG